MVTTGLVKPISLFPVLVFPSVLMQDTKSTIPNGNQCQNLFHSLNSRAHECGPTEQGSQSVMKGSLHMEKEVAFLGMPFLARKGAQTSCSTVQKKWEKRLKKKLEIEVQKQLLQTEAHQTTFFCTTKQILVISKCFLSISIKGSGIPSYRDFYPVKGIETFFSLTWGTHLMSAV